MTEALAIATFGRTTGSAASMGTMGAIGAAGAPSPPSPPAPSVQGGFGGGGGGMMRLHLPYEEQAVLLGFPVRRYVEAGREVFDFRKRGPRQELAYAGPEQGLVPAVELNLTVIGALEAENARLKAEILTSQREFERRLDEMRKTLDVLLESLKPREPARPVAPPRPLEVHAPAPRAPMALPMFSNALSRRIARLRRRQDLHGAGLMFPRLRALLGR